MKRNTGSVAAVASVRFGDKHDPGIDRAIARAEDGLSILHSISDRTLGDFPDQLIKDALFFHRLQRL